MNRRTLRLVVADRTGKHLVHRDTFTVGTGNAVARRARTDRLRRVLWLAAGNPEPGEGEELTAGCNLTHCVMPRHCSIVPRLDSAHRRACESLGKAEYERRTREGVWNGT